MRMEKKNKKWMEEMDVFVLKKLTEEADAYEKQLNSDPQLAGIEPPPELFDRILAQVHAQKKEGKEDKEEKEESDETDAPVEALLSESDRKALEIGRRTLRRKPYRKVLRGLGVAAVALVCVFSASMLSEANRVRVLNAWNVLIGRETIFRLNNVEDREPTSIEERLARQTIEKETGIIAPEFMYSPSGMQYLEYDIENDDEAASMCYFYQDTITLIYMIRREESTEHREIVDGDLVESFFVKGLTGDMEVSAVNALDGMHYVVKFIYNNCYYRIYSALPKEEFIKFIENMVIL